MYANFLTICKTIYQVLTVIFCLRMYLLDTGHVISAGADSVFKSLWYDCDPEWHDPQLAAVFESVLNIREDFYTAIGSESAVDFDVVIEGDPLLMSRLKVRL